MFIVEVATLAALFRAVSPIVCVKGTVFNFFLNLEIHCLLFLKVYDVFMK